MKAKLPILLFIMMNSIIALAQDKSSSSTSADKLHSDLSLYAGYGTHGVNCRIDLEITDKYFHQSSTRFYLELGGCGVSFSNPNFSFDGIEYPSDCRIITLGGGIGQEFIWNKVSFMPFVGLRNEYVRFKSSSLVDAIGNNGVVRYSDNTHTRQLGPVIKNGYGDASAFDIGCRLGIILSPKIQLSGTIGYAPIRFDTADTLFGEFFGEAPVSNPYWVKRKPTRAEAALRFTF